MGAKLTRKPGYLKFKIPGGKNFSQIKRLLKEEGLHTICIEAKCPNIGECFCNGTATFLILGNNCTRNCRYCAVSHQEPDQPDKSEPIKIARAIKRLNIKYAVITSVTRDDLPDGGASHFAETVNAVRDYNRDCKIELLIPDFMHVFEPSIDHIIQTRPDVINHNIEATKNLFQKLRPQGNYQHSLHLLKYVSKSGITTKSGLMIGFGETMDDIKSTLQDLYNNGCKIITIGQYLQSTKDGFPVQYYYSEEEFKYIEQAAGQIGFKHISCGPLVRSSYHAAKLSE